MCVHIQFIHINNIRAWRCFMFCRMHILMMVVGVFFVLNCVSVFSEETLSQEKLLEIVHNKKWDALPKTIISPKDNKEMVLIPAGEFRMGIPSDSTLAAKLADATPAHNVYLDAYYMDKCEVTNEEYEKYLADSSAKKPLFSDDSLFNNPRQPVVGISYGDAVSYARWAGKRLPTEAEWEKSARGTDGRIYPWGQTFSQNLCNSYKSQVKAPLKVGSFPNGASPYGLLDMAGNVSEWVFDAYDSGYYKNSPLKNPQGPAGTSDDRLTRGGNYTSDPEYVTTVVRFPQKAYSAFPNIGFRCAVSVSEIETLFHPEKAKKTQEAISSTISVIKSESSISAETLATKNASLLTPSGSQEFVPVRYFKYLDFDGTRSVGREEIRKSERIGLPNWKVYYQPSGLITQAQFYDAKDNLQFHIEPVYDEKGQEKTVRLYNQKGEMVYISERIFKDGVAIRGTLYTASGDYLGEERF